MNSVSGLLGMATEMTDTTKTPQSEEHHINISNHRKQKLRTKFDLIEVSDVYQFPLKVTLLLSILGLQIKIRLSTDVH